MRQGVRLLSIGAAAAISAATLAVNPFAQAQTAESVDDIMKKCAKARFIQGVEQSFPGIDDHALATTCDFIEDSFTTSSGPTVKASVDFANCPPDTFANGQAEVTYKHTVEQTVGTTKVNEQEYEALAGPINATWTIHDNVTDLSQRSVEITNTDVFTVPEGQVLSVWYTPKINTLKGHWKVYRERKDTPGGVQEEYNASVPETITGPAILPSGSMDGTAQPKYEPC